MTDEQLSLARVLRVSSRCSGIQRPPKSQTTQDNPIRVRRRASDPRLRSPRSFRYFIGIGMTARERARVWHVVSMMHAVLWDHHCTARDFRFQR